MINTMITIFASLLASLYLILCGIYVRYLFYKIIIYKLFGKKVGKEFDKMMIKSDLMVI